MKIFKTDEVVKPTPDNGKGALFWQNKMFFMSADIMSSLCRVRLCVCMNNFFPKLQDWETCCFVSKYTLTIEDKKLFKACRCVHLFPRAITSEVPPPKVWKFQHFITSVSSTIAGIFLLLCIYVLGH